jgi:hypothetical protein
LLEPSSGPPVQKHHVGFWLFSTAPVVAFKGQSTCGGPTLVVVVVVVVVVVDAEGGGHSPEVGSSALNEQLTPSESTTVTAGPRALWSCGHSPYGSACWTLHV